MTETNVTLDAEAIAILRGVTTATLTTILLKKGLRNVWIRGGMPLRPEQERVVGPAFTFRFVPLPMTFRCVCTWRSVLSTFATRVSRSLSSR